jgi:hypothetical protein
MSRNNPSLLVASDPARRAKYRAHQSWYRETILKVPPGYNHAGKLLGSMLPADEVKKRPGLNFLTENIALYVEKRVPEVRAAGGTLEEDRLRRNMLSSMPLCFNLFGELRAFPDIAASVLSRALQLDIHEVTNIEVEWSPWKNYLQDKTAFDAFVAYKNSKGAKGFIGVETKYSEPFSKTEYDSAVYRSITTEERFNAGAADRLTHQSTNQLWRNTMLALCVRDNEGYDESFVLVLSCEDDPSVKKALSGLQRELLVPELARAISLESLLLLCAEHPTLSTWASEFQRRYFLVVA